MITINGEKGFVRIESWDDIESRPGFAKDIDPRSVKLKAIIGSYTFSDYIPCGLSTCHQPHGNGFLVVTVDGRETNIGRICGKRHFSRSEADTSELQPLMRISYAVLCLTKKK